MKNENTGNCKKVEKYENFNIIFSYVYNEKYH